MHQHGLNGIVLAIRVSAAVLKNLFLHFLIKMKELHSSFEGRLICPIDTRPEKMALLNIQYDQDLVHTGVALATLIVTL